jgi:hypothetical protein
MKIDRILSQVLSGRQYVFEYYESAGEIKTMAPGVKKGLTRFQTKSECHIVALGITTVSRGRPTQKHKYWHHKRYHGEPSCMTHALSPLNANTLLWHSACRRVTCKQRGIRRFI